MTTTPSAEAAQAGASNKPGRRFRIRASLPADSPERIAARARRIRIARAFNLIARTKVSVAAALRATGLDRDHNAREDLAGLLDLRGIPRIRKGVRRVRAPETPSQVFETFIPRQEGRRQIAAMVAELRSIADPSGDDVPRAPKPPVICTCTVCCEPFESKQRRARYCGVRCRVAHWRAQQ